MSRAIAVVAGVETLNTTLRLIPDAVGELSGTPRSAPALLRFVVAFGALAVARLATAAAVVVAVLAVARTAPTVWPVVLIVGAVALAALGELVGGRLAGLIEGDEPLPEPAAALVARLADRAGVAAPLSRLARSADSQEAGAQLLGNRRRPRLVITPTLAEGPADQLEVVVAHELGHLRLGHAAVVRRLELVGAVAVIGLLWWLTTTSLAGPFGGQPTDPAALPLWLAVASWAALAAELEVARRARAHERAADRFASELLEDPGRVADQRRRHEVGRGRVGRFGSVLGAFSLHPPPRVDPPPDPSGRRLPWT